MKIIFAFKYNFKIILKKCENFFNFYTLIEGINKIIE